MLIIYYLSLKKPLFLLLSYLLQVGPYYLLMKKLGLRGWYAFLPNVAEYKLSRKVFPKRRTFFRPLIVAAVLIAFAYYVGPSHSAGLLYTAIAFMVWGIYLVRLYARICKAFGKKTGYTLLAILLPPVFLSLLCRGSAEFTPPEFKPEKPCAKWWKITKRIAFWILTVIELLAIIAGCGYYAIKNRVPGFLINEIINETNEQAKDVQATGELVTREDVLGTSLAAVTDANRSRDWLAADHSDDTTVNVYVYIIGSNLENDSGAASVNIRQMLTASEQGSGLKFIVEAGGSERWFTKGIKNNSYGRYEITNGKLTLMETLPADTNMSDAQTLADFLTWANGKYDADRNILVFWDHGGGIEYGFGLDSLNSPNDDTMQVPDLVDAIAQSGMTFDLIGFDACLMQNIETAAALAPYADYYLASEETEGSNGWFYTEPFGALAQDPTMSTEELGRQLVACYDPYNTATDSDGEVHTDATLSLIDLTMVESAYSRLSDFLSKATDEIIVNPESFADTSLAAANAYDFSNYQLDLIDFLSILDSVDYDNSVATEEEMQKLIQSIQACVICRNGASANGINGIAVAFPYNCVTFYDDTSKNLKSLSMENEKHSFDVFFSIIAAQGQKSNTALQAVFGESGGLLSMIADLLPTTDYTTSDWYIAGFEDYDDTDQFIDLPLTEVENGWQVDLPEKTWSTVTDVQTMVYQQVENDTNGAVRRYIGNDYLGGTDENGHTLVDASTSWPHINGQLVCFESDTVKITDDGEIYSGKIQAMLNNDTPVYLYIEWNPEVEGQQMTARILGYEPMDTAPDAMPDKGYQQLQTGDSLQFLFDYYDEEGNLIETRVAGDAIRVTDPGRLQVTDEALEPCTIEFGGVLKDVYQRLMTTEMVQLTIQ